MSGRLVQFGLLGTALTVVLAACLPFPPFFYDPIAQPVPSFCEGAAVPGGQTTFTHLSATVVLSGGDSRPKDLGPVPDGVESFAAADTCGLHLRGAWSDPTGDLLLTVEEPAVEMGMEFPNPSGDPSGQVAIILEQPHHRPPLVFFDFPEGGAPHGCTVTLTEHSTAGFVGHARCPAASWQPESEADPFVPPPSGTPTFDLSIDFSALP